MKRKTVILLGALALMLSGCGAVKETSDGTEVQKEPPTEESTVVGATDELIDSDRFEGESDTYDIAIYETKNQERYAQIIVKDESEDIATLTIEQDEWGDIMPEISDMIMEKDVDFDGNKDVLVRLGSFGENEDKRYKCYLVNSSGLNYCSGFEMIDNPCIYSDMQIITGYLKGDSELVTYNRYEYADDSFQKTDSIDLYRESNADCYDDIFFDIMFNREQADMKAAYEYIIDSYEKAYPSCTYDLIYFNDDNTPELVVGMDGYFVSMYTFCDGRMYSLMHNWAYGAGGNHGYEYIEKEGIIRNYNSDYAGAVMHTAYFEMTDQPSIVVKYFLEQSYEDEDGNIVQDESEDVKAEWKYYYNTNDSEQEEVSEKNFQSYMIDGEYLSVCGKYTKEEVVEEINKLEALSQNESEAESMEYALIDESAYSECKLKNKDFEVVYKGYTIDGQTTAEDIKKNLGLPEDFEDNHEGYITTVDQEWRWMIRYPDFSESSDIKVIFYTNLDTDETQIKSVELYNSETYRGLKVGDSIKDIYEEYGLPTEKESYGKDYKDLELRYIKDNQRLSFGVDQESQMIKYIHIGYNLSEDER